MLKKQINKIMNIKNYITLTVFSIFLLFGEVFCQTKFLSPIEQLEKANATSGLFSPDIMQSNKEVLPVGNVISPEAYYLGPNDLLSIQIYPIEPYATPTYVTAENTIYSQRFGEININGLTLKEVRDTLTQLITKRNPNATVSISLLKPRNVFITISGNVLSPGSYTLPASYSVSTVLKVANQFKTTSLSADEQSALLRLNETQKERARTFSEMGVPINTSYSTRNIRILRKNDKSLVADLERANATNDSKYDPFICEGDEIFVPFDVENYPVISIVGEVLRPMTLAFKEGDMVSQLLKMGYGFTENADLDNIYLYDGLSNKEKLQVDTNCNLLSSDIKLKAGNIIAVGSLYDTKQSNIGMVSVKGEVKNPNIYVIQPGVTKLKDIIEKAGGFTKKAYLPRSYIARRENQQNDRVAPKRLYMEYFQKSDLTMEDTTRFMMDIDLKRNAVACNLDDAFNKNSEEDNVVLQDGDVIFINTNINRVTVFGQVRKPGIIEFTPNKNMEWYIEQAGGYATGAKKSRARIIRNNTKVWENGFQDAVFVNDGDEIYVPREPDIPPTLELQKWAAITGMVGALSGIISLIITAFR